MKILYKNNRLEKTFSSLSKMKKAYGTRAKVIDVRLQELSAATCLEDIKFLPQAKLHKLSGKQEGFLAVSISGNWRIIFEPCDGNLDDLKSIRTIKIEQVVDYH